MAAEIEVIQMMRYDPCTDKFIEEKTTAVPNYAYGAGTSNDIAGIKLPQTLQIELSDACIEKIATAIARKMRGE